MRKLGRLRGRLVALGELRAALERAFDDKQITDADAQLEALGEAHDNAYCDDARR